MLPRHPMRYLGTVALAAAAAADSVLKPATFSPPYLFREALTRSILSAPAAAGYGQEFFLATEDAPRVTRVTLVRLGSVTHGFDQNQRFLELGFRRAAGGLTVSAPVEAEPGASRRLSALYSERRRGAVGG